MALELSDVIGEVSVQNFLLFIFAIILTIIFGNIVNILLVRMLKSKTSPVFYKTMSKLAMYSIYVLGFYLAFQKILNFSIPAFLTALGVLGITFLLTTLPILQNIFAGIVLSLERPFREGDVVEVNGNVCIVKDMMLRKTVLRSLDGKIIVVSNLQFMTGEVANYSKGEFLRVELMIDIKNDANLKKAMETINKILHEDPHVLPHIPNRELNIIQKLFVMPQNLSALEPQIFIRSVDKNKITLQVWFWIWDILRKEVVVSRFNENLLKEFKDNRINFG
jgi:small-conductance mechanosensitive channel